MANLPANATAASGGFDWSILATPSGVVLGALIAGTVAWRNSRKSVYERLESLAKTRKDWPVGLDGTETVDQSLALALAEVRKREKHDTAVTPAERRADREVSELWTREHRIAFVGVVVAIIGVLIAAVAAGTTQAQTAQQSSPGWASIIVNLITVIGSAVVVFFAFRHR